jgi:hypothetical protein
VLDELLQLDEETPKDWPWRVRLGDLIARAYTDDPYEYVHRWLPYLTTRLEVWPSVLLECGSFGDLDFYSHLVPGARFSVFLHKEWGNDLLSPLVNSPTSRDIAWLDVTPIRPRHSDIVTLCSSTHLGDLERLIIRQANISRAGIEHLADTNAMPKVTELDLGETCRGYEEVNALSNAEVFPCLERLVLDGCGVEPSGMERLVHGRLFHHLERLDVGGNHLGNNGMFVLSTLTDSSLRVLRAGTNEVTDEGAQYLANAPALRHLKVLSLDYNHIEDQGALALMESVYLSRLQVIDLAGNPLTEHGKRALEQIANERSVELWL